MALGGGGLGTLTLYINADTSDFDQAISQVERRARAFGTRFSQVDQQLDLAPQVDDSQLTALNKHLSLKQQHFQQVGRFMQQMPLTPKVQVGQLEELKAELKEVADLQRQTVRQFEQNPVAMPRITIAPRINNRTVNEAPRITNRFNGSDLKLTGNVAPKVTVSNRLNSEIQRNTTAARGASASPEQAKTKLKQIENQIDRIDHSTISPGLDIEAIERFTKRIAELEAQVDRLNEKSQEATKRSTGVGKAIKDVLPGATEQVASGVGTGISQGLSQAIPVFAGKMGDAASNAIATAVAKSITPQIKINTPEFKFQTSFTDIVRAGRELTGATENLKEATKAANKKDNPITGFIGRIGGSLLTGVGQSVGNRLSSGVVSGLENKLEIKFREAAEAAVVVLADGLEDALGIQFKSVGNFVKEKVPEVFEPGRAGRRKSAPGTQPPTTVENALTYLAGQDDGAVSKDRKGFNKLDTQRGRNLATKIKVGQKLTQEEAKAALQMLQKYRKQLAEAQQGSLPEWDKISNQYAQAASSAPSEEQKLQQQLEQLKQQVAEARANAAPEELQKQAEEVQKVEADLQNVIEQKRKDLIDAMMSSREITLNVLKPIGRRLNVPDVDKPRSEGGLSKEQLIKEIVGRSNPDALRKEIPFIPVPVSKDVVKEAESRASMSPEKLRESLLAKRKTIAQAIARNPGQKSGGEVAAINNVIQKEYQVINNLMSRDLTNSAKRYLKTQRQALTKMSGNLANEVTTTPGAAPVQAPAQSQNEIPDPWLDVDQMRSQANATKSAFEIIGDAIGAFVDGLQDYAVKITAVLKSILNSVGGLFRKDSGSQSRSDQGGGPASENSAAHVFTNAQRNIQKQVEVAQKLVKNYTDKETKQQAVSEVAQAIKEKYSSADVGKSISSNHEFETFVSAGFSGTGGYNPEVYKQLTKGLGSKHSVTPIFNTDYDADVSAGEDQIGWATSAIGKIAQAGGQGVNPVAKQMADQAYQAWLRDPSKKIRFAGYSGGAHAASDALEVFKQLAPDADAKAVGIGGAPLDYKRSNLSTEDYQNVIRSDDLLIRGVTSAAGMDSEHGVISNPNQTYGIHEVATAHSLNSYAGDENTFQSIKDFLESSSAKKAEEKPHETGNKDYYQEVLTRLTGSAANKLGVSLQASKVPSLEFNDEHLQRVGARAQYNLKENKLLLSSDVKKFFEALRTGTVDLNKYEEELKDVFHELKHGFQYDFGRLNQGKAMAGAQLGPMTPFAQTSRAAQRYGQAEANSDYYKQFARQTSNPDKFLEIIRDTEADAEHFAESWKELVEGAFDIDDTSLHNTVLNAVEDFTVNLFPKQQPKVARSQDNFAVNQRRGVTGAVRANTGLKNGLDAALESFNNTFDLMKRFEAKIASAVGAGGDTLDDAFVAVQHHIQNVEAQIDAGIHRIHQLGDDITVQGATETVDFLDKLSNQLDEEVENVEKFIAYVRKETGGRADPAINAVQSQFRSKVAGVQQNLTNARDNAAIRAGIITPQISAPPQQLTIWQKILKNIREEIRAINSGEDIKTRMTKGAAADLGIDLNQQQASFVAQNAHGGLHAGQQAVSVAQAALKGSWTDVLEEMMDEIDEFTDHALDRFADFVGGIPGGNVFAKVIRGAKEFKGVIFGFIGLKTAWEGLVQVKEWLDSFDDVFVDAAVGWEKFENLISFSSKTFDQAQTNIKFVRDEAKRLNTDLKQSMQGFSQLAASAIDTGMEGTGTKRLFASVNQASSAYGLDGEAQNRVYTALSQMMSKNTVSSEELKQQLGEILPGSFQIAARAAGKTTQEFTQLLETGQVLAEELLPKLADQLSAETAAGVAGSAGSAQAATNKFNNSLLELQVSLGKFGIDERNIIFNTMANMMDFAAKNAVVLSYAMGSLLAGAIWALGGAFKVFIGRLVQTASSFLMTRLGITTLGLSLKTLGATIAASAKSFLLLTVVMETVAMISAAMKDSSGKSRDFANSMTDAYGKIAGSIAEARGELDKFNASQGKGKQKQQKIVGRDSILDEAPLLSWLLPKEINKDDSWFNKARFGVRDKLTSATEGFGFLTNPMAAIDAVRKNDRTLAPTYGNKKFQDQKRSTTEMLDVANKSVAVTNTALNDKELQKVKAYDEQLRQIQIKRRGIVQVNPGNKKDLNELKRQEEKILDEREKSFKPLGAIQSSNQIAIQGVTAEIEKYKELIAKGESDLSTAANGKDKKDIQARLDYYKQTLPQLEENLKKVQDAQDAFTKSIGESVDKFILLQKQLQNVADRLADANDSIQMIGNSAKSDLSQAVARGDITPGQAEFSKGQIDRDVLEEQLRRKRSAANEYRGLLFGTDAQAILESRGVKSIDDVGQAQLGTLASKAKDGTPEKEVFARLQDMKKLELEASELQAQVDAAKEQAAQQIRDANKQIADYFRDISRQSAEFALSTKEAQAQIALQEQKNKLKSALQGFQDNFFSSFVDSLIDGMDSLNEPIMADIEKQRDIQSANYAQEDRNRQTSELYRSLPLDTQAVKLDFSKIDSAPVKELQSTLEKSAQASKNVTEASKATGAAITTSATEAGKLQTNVGKVDNSAQNVKSATDSVTTSLQENVTKAQDVQGQLESNKDATDNHRAATEGVNDAITTQAQKIFESMTATEQSTEQTNGLKAAWDTVVAGVVDVTTRTWEWFKGLGQNVPFIAQFGEMIAGWGKNIQDLIGKTWEWLQGLGKNIPFLQQIGQTIGGWGQNIGGAVQDGMQNAGNLWNQGVGAVRGALGMGKGVGNIGGFNIVESVGGSVQRVNNFRDLEKHHPSSGREAGRSYATIDNELEEVRQTRDGRTLIKKDFVLNKGGSQNVDIPAFAEGYIKRLNDSVNTVQIYQDKAMTKLIGQSLHMNNIPVQTGDFVRYGQSIGKQSGAGGYATHAHLEMEQANFERYIRDLRTGNFAGNTAGTTGTATQHHLGDGHNHFGEEDAKKANQQAARQTIAPTSTGRGTLPQLRQGYGSVQKLGETFSGNAAFNSNSPEGRARLALVMATGGAEVYSKGSTATDFFTRRGGTSNNMLGALQYNRAYNLDKYDTPQEYVEHTGQIFSGRRALPNGRTGRDFGAGLSQAIASGQIKSGRDLENWMRKSGLGGSNWQGVDDGFGRVPGLTDDLVKWLQTGQGNPASGGGMPMNAGASVAATVPSIMPTPFASMGQQYSGTSVNTAPLSQAQQKSDEMARVQRQQALDKEKARTEQARLDGEQRQRQRLEQLRQNLLEQNKNRTQLTRQFRDLGFDSQLQTPNIEAMRKKIGINDQFDDIKLANEEDIRKTTAGRDQAKALLSKLTAPDYVAQPGQDVGKDIEGAKRAIASAEAYLKDLTRVQGDIETQRKAHLQFQTEQEEREKKLREQQEKFATEEVDISVLEARVQKLKDMQSRGIRDQGVENLPKLEATIAARREELQLNQKLVELDEKIRTNKDNAAVVGELNKQKAGLQDRLKVVRETIEANRTYSEEVMRRDNAKVARDAANAQAQAELEVLKQQLAGIQQVAQVKPNAQGVDQIPQLEETIALKEQELKLANDLAAVEEERFANKIDDEQYKARVAQIQAENDLTKENIELKRQQADIEQQRAAQDRAMEISGRMVGSRNSVLSGKADLLSSVGLDTQAKEYRRAAAINDQKQSYSQESLNLERFIQQMQLSNEQALELRSNLGAVNEMKLDQIDKEFSTMNELMVGVQGSFESAFASVLDGSKSIGEAALDFLKGIGSQLASMASKMITDELFGGLMGKSGHKGKAAADAEAIAGGGFLGGQGNPLANITMMNPLPVVMTNAGAIGGGMMPAGGMGGFASGNSFMDGIFGGQGGFFGENVFGNNPLPVNMVKANDNLFSSITDGLVGIFGGGEGGGGLGGLLSGALSLFGGGGGGASAGGGGFTGVLGMLPSLFGLFHAGGIVGNPAHTQNLAKGGTVGCGCMACAMARGGSIGSGIEESLEQALQRERSLNGGKRARVIVATDGELVVPTKVAERLNPRTKNFLIGRSSPPEMSRMNYATGGVVGSTMGSAIANNVTNNMGGSTKIEGSTVNVGEGGGSMTKEEGARLKQMIDASVVETISKHKRPRGLLY